MTRQKIGLYLTYGGYAAGLVGVVLAAHHLPILISFAVAIALVFIGRQLETGGATPTVKGNG